MTSDLLLSTKLSIPPNRPKFLERQRLFSRLTDGLEPGNRVILVSAPAGYGKSSLIANWFTRQTEEKTGKFYGLWVSLDEGDDEPLRFLNYLIAALQKLDGSTGESAQSMMTSPNIPSHEILMTSLINDLIESRRLPVDETRPLASPIVIAFDDFQKIRSQYILQAVQFLLDHQPPDIHLVIISREDPPLQLSKMRARGEMIEIRARDLRFTVEEIELLLNELMELNLAPEWIRSLEMRTEGWIVGLQLAALSLQRSADQAAFLEDFSGSHRYLIDYLMDEVLRQQDETIREFLYETSILDRFTGPLCQAVTGRSDSLERLIRLEEANLFVIPLDERREWYRYHHLFSDFLRMGLEREHETALHKKAAQWFEENGYFQEAIEHALKANNYSQAGQLIQKTANQLIAQGGISIVLKWLSRFPEEIVQANCALLSLQAWCLNFTGHSGEAVKAMALLELFPAEQMDDHSLGIVLSLKSWAANWLEDDRAVSLANKGIKLIADTDPLIAATTMIPLGHTHRRMNAIDKAIQTYGDAAAIAKKNRLILVRINCLSCLTVSLNEMGRRTEAAAILADARQDLVDGLGRPIELVGMLSVGDATVWYEANELDKAVEYALQGKKACQQFISNKVMGGEIERVLIQAYAAQGNLAASYEVIHEEREQGRHLGKWMAFVIDALEAELQRKYGDKEKAIRWLNTQPCHPDKTYQVTHEQVYIVHARILIEQGSFQEAKHLLDWLENATRNGKRYAPLITILILQAWLEQRLDNKALAFEYLYKAIKLAEPDFYIRRFLDDWAGIETLIKDPQFLHREHIPPVRTFIASLINPPTGKRDSPYHMDLTQNGRISQHRPNLSRECFELLEPLSEQELKVLRLVSYGRTNQEIADLLIISVGTVKWHVHNIFGKLGVKNRAQAIARTRELNILK